MKEVILCALHHRQNPLDSILHYICASFLWRLLEPITDVRNLVSHDFVVSLNYGLLITSNNRSAQSYSIRIIGFQEKRLLDVGEVKNAVVWDVAPCGSGENRRFGGI
jgi:hypothetical protein